MKTLILLLSLIIIKPDSVYICTGGSSYAYHNTEYCMGLKNCRHKIIKVSLDDAVKKYNRKACHYCFK